MQTRSIETDKVDSEKIEERFKNLKDIFLTKDDKVDMIKWMFLFWASSVVATLGGLLAIVKFMVK